MSLHLERVRKAGLLEQFHIVRHFLGMDSCVVGTSQYTTEDGMKLTKETLYPALRHMLEKFGALGVRLQGDESTTNVDFVRLPSVDLSRIVTFSESVDLEAALEAQLMQRFETQADLPLWRLEVLGDNTVIFAFHHAIADGMSSIAFHIHLVKALRTDSSPVPSPVIQIPTSARMTDAVDSMTNVRPSVSTITHELLKLVVPPSKKLWTGGDSPSVADLSTTRVRLVSIPPALAKQLLDACRVNKTTATGAIYALLSCITARLLDKSTQRKHNKLEGLIAVSMHPLTGVGDYDICDHPSSFHTVGPLTTEFSWTNAVQVTNECRVYKTKAREQIGMLKFLFGRLDWYFKDHLGKKRECGIVLSNLGRWTAPKAEGPWTIGKPWFTHGDMVIGGFFSASIVGDPSGAMNVAFNWRETIVETEWMDKLVSLFLEELGRVSTK